MRPVSVDEPRSDPALGRAVGELAAAEPDPAGMARVASAAVRSMRAAGARAVASGRWLADVALDVAPRLPVRDVSTLQAQHGGLSGPALAGVLIRKASRNAGAVGAVSGALMSAQQLAPPAWLALPAELVAETLAVAAIEMKLIAELHEVYGQPVTGNATERGLALARAWASRRGVNPISVLRGQLGDSLGRGVRREVRRMLQRRLALRTARNTVTLAPFLVGAVAGEEVNRRATRALGEAVVHDLAAR